MLFRRLNQACYLPHLRRELFTELSLLIITPGLFELIHL